MHSSQTSTIATIHALVPPKKRQNYLELQVSSLNRDDDCEQKGRQADLLQQRFMDADNTTPKHFSGLSMLFFAVISSTAMECCKSKGSVPQRAASGDIGITDRSIECTFVHEEVNLPRADGYPHQLDVLRCGRLFLTIDDSLNNSTGGWVYFLHRHPDLERILSERSSVNSSTSFLVAPVLLRADPRRNLRALPSGHHIVEVACENGHLRVMIDGIWGSPNNFADVCALRRDE